MQIFNISEKVRLCCVDTGNKFNTNIISVSMLMPLDENTSARAVLPSLLKSRCAKYPDRREFSKRLDELYGAHITGGVSKSGEAQMLSLAFSGIDDRFTLEGESVSGSGIELLMETLFNPVIKDGTFPGDIISEEKRVHLERINDEKNNKRIYAVRKLEEKMFCGEAFARSPLGTAEEVSALDGATVYKAWHDVLEGATIQITAVGGISDEKILGVVKKYFEKLQRKPVELKTEVINDVADVKYFSEEQPIKQGKLVMGFRTGIKNPERLYPEMKVAVDIFGGGTYSKLFSVVREKMSLCYYCSAVLNSKKGIVCVQSGIENVNEEKAKSEILNQLSLVASGDFTDEILDSSVKAMTDSVISSNDTPGSLDIWYISQSSYDEVLTPEEYAERLRIVDRASVIEAAKSIKADTIFMLKASGEGENNEN